MENSISDIKRKAKIQIKGNAFNSLLLAMMFIFVFAAMPYFFKEVGILITFLLSAPIFLGLCILFLSIARVDKTPSEEMKVSKTLRPLGLDFVHAIKSIGNVNPYQANLSLVFYGFKHYFKAQALFLWNILLISLWSVLLVVPGIIKAISLSMSFFILADNPSVSVPKAMVLSEKMTQGHKKDLFLIGLSFIGWILLTVASFTLASFVTLPYIMTSYALVYEQLKKESISKGVIAEDDIVSLKTWEY